MPCPHNEISIVQRSNRQSAVAAAAYQSGEKLFCEYDQEVKHYPEKRGIVHNEILLPANAPPEYADRSTLWNAAEAIEKQWNSQLARRWVLSIPREIPPDQYAALVRDFCNQQFVSKGMCVDFAIHDKGDGNPHAHVMLTMRAMDERGKWLPKSRKVYDLNENGERIKLPSGRWKSHKEDTVDWNDRKYCEIWRHEWEVIQNRYLEANNRPERVDLRSYERQGLDIIPTVHEGAAVRQMEKRGIQTNIGNLNREIKAANSLMQSIRQLIKNLKGWIAELSEKRNELLAQKAAEEAVFLPNLLMKYIETARAYYLAEHQDEPVGRIQNVAVTTLEKFRSGVRKRRNLAPRSLPENDVRFIDPMYNELFRVPDGGVVQITYPDGHQRSEKVEYLDDYHMKIGSTVQHICEFAERMARSRGIVEPEPLTQQEQRAWNLEYDYYLTVQAEDGAWNYALYQGDCCLLERGKIDAPELMIEEVRDEIMYTHNLRNKDCIPLTQEEFTQKLADRNEIQSYRIHPYKMLALPENVMARPFHSGQVNTVL